MPSLLIVSVLPNIIIIAQTLAHSKNIEIIKVCKCHHEYELKPKTIVQNKEVEKIFLCFSNSKKEKTQKLRGKSFYCFRFKKEAS